MLNNVLICFDEVFNAGSEVQIKSIYRVCVHNNTEYYCLQLTKQLIPEHLSTEANKMPNNILGPNWIKNTFSLVYFLVEPLKYLVSGSH